MEKSIEIHENFAKKNWNIMEKSLNFGSVIHEQITEFWHSFK